MCQAAFYGIGAYTTAILSTRYALSFYATLPIAVTITLGVGLLASVVAIRTVGDYFVVCTLGVQVILGSVMNNWTEVTRGPLGITAIPPIRLGTVMIENRSAFLAVCITMTACVWFVVRNVFNSGFGRALRALSEDEVFTASMGKDVRQIKIMAFSLGSALAAIPGALYAHCNSYIDPTSFSLSESILVLCIVILGGRSLIGACIGSTVLVILPEALRFAGFPPSAAEKLKQIVYGLALTSIMMTSASSVGDLFRRQHTQKPQIVQQRVDL